MAAARLRYKSAYTHVSIVGEPSPVAFSLKRIYATHSCRRLPSAPCRRTTPGTHGSAHRSYIWTHTLGHVRQITLCYMHTATFTRELIPLWEVAEVEIHPERVAVAAESAKLQSSRAQSASTSQVSTHVTARCHHTFTGMDSDTARTRTYHRRLTLHSIDRSRCRVLLSRIQRAFHPI